MVNDPVLRTKKVKCVLTLMFVSRINFVFTHMDGYFLCSLFHVSWDLVFLETSLMESR
jgi:hypothetical protein